MKGTSWLCWLLTLSVICLSEAQYKFRRPHLPPPPPPLPPPQIFKKSWAPGPRIPPMGNSVHIAGNFPHKRPLLKPPNYRFRRPPGPPPPPLPSPMFNVLPSSYKNPLPPSGNLGFIGTPGNFAGLTSQRIGPSVKEQLPSIGKVPQPQYSPQDYHLSEELTSLATHRGGIDDDKGPIHTIPAPNLGPASKSYQQQALFTSQENKGEEQQPAKRPYSITQIDYATVFNGHDSNVSPQRVLPAISSTTIQHQYEVTESNEVNSAAPAYFDSQQYASSITEQQANDVFLSHQSSAGSRSTQQQQQVIGSGGIIDQGASLQANLHSTMHVGSSGAGAGLQQQVSDLHVGQPGAAGPPVSTAKLYEVLNQFPQQLPDQFSLNQQPQIQQHLLQQQISQILQQQQQQQQQDDQNTLVKASFAQPVLHSFNYDEQANKQKQHQNVLIDQNYASGRVTADYNLAPEASEITPDVSGVDAGEHHENNIEFENPVGQVKPTSYFTKIGDDQTVPTQFYTTLPNREAAEKLAALAAAGNVNSQLIGQLRKQQQHKEQQSQVQQQPQSDQPMPANHKEGDESYQNAEKYNERQRHEHRQKLFYRHRQKIRDEQLRHEEEKEKYNQQNNDEDEKHPLRIFVPEANVEDEKEVHPEDYEYENDEADVPRETEPSSEDTEFGSRIISKNRK